MHIISASRKTDIPTFYMEWFMNRIKEGKAYVINPYNKRAVEVSLKREDVAAIVFLVKKLSASKESINRTQKLRLSSVFSLHHYWTEKKYRTICKSVSSTNRYLSMVS